MIEYDAAAGNGFCVQCGTVVEENTIVSEVGTCASPAASCDTHLILGNLWRDQQRSRDGAGKLCRTGGQYVPVQPTQLLTDGVLCSSRENGRAVR